jgi:ADP-dependent phosphofructokinase/glucokinase
MLITFICSSLPSAIEGVLQWHENGRKFSKKYLKNEENVHVELNWIEARAVKNYIMLTILETFSSLTDREYDK